MSLAERTAQELFLWVAALDDRELAAVAGAPWCVPPFEAYYARLLRDGLRARAFMRIRALLLSGLQTS